MKRLDYLDSVRAIAALMVVIQHSIGIAINKNLIGNKYVISFFQFLTDTFIDIGKIGVILFFMLSGFVISFSLQNGSNIKHFYIKRFFRLYPVFWLSILFGIIFLHETPPSFLNILSNATMIPNIFGQEAIIGVYWTLQIEIIFYVIVGFLFKIKLLYKERSMFFVSLFFLFIALVFSVLRFYLHKKIPVALPLSLSLMCFSSIFMRLIVFESKIAKKYVKYYILNFIVYLPIICILSYNVDFGFHEKWYRYLFSYFIAFILFLLFVVRLQINNKYLVRIGVVSYGIYLFHPIFLNILQIDLFMSNFLLYFASVVCFTIGFSFMSFYCFEKPIINWSHKILRKNK